MTTERTPPTKVQCLRSGRIFPRSQIDLIPGVASEASTCPACGFGVQGVYTPCTNFQDLNVDVT
jgi:hypothetical protein